MFPPLLTVPCACVRLMHAARVYVLRVTLAFLCYVCVDSAPKRLLTRICQGRASGGVKVCQHVVCEDWLAGWMCVLLKCCSAVRRIDIISGLSVP